MTVPRRSKAAGARPRAHESAPATLNVRQAQAADTRRRVLACALAQFASQPYDAVAVGAIADAAGVAHGLVFHYFGSKHGLYLEVMREIARELHAVHRVPAGGDAGTRIRRMLTRHLRYMGDHPGLALTLLRGGLGTDREAWTIIEDTRRAATAWMCEELGLPADHPAFRLALRAMAGAIDEATVLWIEQQRRWPVARLLAALMEMLGAALRGACALDPSLDIDAAVAALQQPLAAPVPGRANVAGKRAAARKGRPTRQA